MLNKDRKFFEIMNTRVSAIAAQKVRKTECDTRAIESSNFRIGVTRDGILINGDYGTCPSVEEMEELANILKEMVAEYDYLQEHGSLIPCAPFSSDTNIRDLMEYAMTLHDEMKAHEFWEALITWAMENWTLKDRPGTRENAEALMRQNIGYWSGYYNTETANRMRKLFHAYHPVLGF